MPPTQVGAAALIWPQMIVVLDFRSESVVARPEIPVTISSSSIFSLPPQHVFAIAEDIGYVGVEIMVTQNRWTHHPTKLDELSQRHSMPIHAVHASTLLLTQQV